MFRRLFGRKNKFDDAAKMEFATLIADLLALQLIVAGDVSIEDEQGLLKRKALGYVYGFVDASLRVKGHDMADLSIGVPILFHVFRKLWPNHAEKCLDFVVKNGASDALMMAGVMRGGQQYLDHQKPDAAGVPMGLGIFMIEGDKAPS
jgi:hypothetical protein